MSKNLPFDGAISTFYEKEAPEPVRNAIRRAEKGDILDPSFPHSEKMPRKAYEKEMAALQIELVKLQASLTQPLVEKAVAYARSVYEIASEGQEEFSKVFETQLAELNKFFVTSLDQAAKSAPAGSEPMFAAAKQAIATANNAYDSMTKAAKQVSELAEANVAAATKAPAKATRARKAS